MARKPNGDTRLEFGAPRARLRDAADGGHSQRPAFTTLDDTTLDDTTLDDTTLVVRAREGDVAAFETLVRRYRVPVYQIAVRILPDTCSAADTAQEAFVAAWQRLYEVKDERAFAAWLYRITVTRALNTLRAVRPYVPLDELAAASDRFPGPEEHALADGLAAALRCALNRLTSEQRACWILREMEGLSYEEVATILHTTPSAVRGRLYRARPQLAAELRPWR
jgi:RNA polymerase sigma-70 factor, ECF subfamily